MSILWNIGVDVDNDFEKLTLIKYTNEASKKFFDVNWYNITIIEFDIKLFYGVLYLLLDYYFNLTENEVSNKIKEKSY